MHALRIMMVLLLLGAAGPAVAAGPEAIERRVFALVRTTDGPASFSLSVDTRLGPDQPYAFQAQVSARQEHGRVVRAASLGAATAQYDGGVVVRAGDDQVQVCQATGGCVVNRVLAGTSTTTSSDGGGPDVDNLLLVVLEGPADVGLEAQGWVLRPLEVDYRYTRSPEAEGAGIFTGVQSASLFLSATQPGGPGGSIAVGTPPCSSAAVFVGAPVPRGAGTAMLTGGRQPASLTCPTNVGRASLTDVAEDRTAWSLAGPVAGEATGIDVPLFVLDLPRPTCLLPAADDAC